MWKSASVAKAIKISNWEFIFLIDADLLNLKSENIKIFLKPIFENQSDVVIAYLKNSWPLFPFKKIDYCSWQRIISKKILLENIDEIEKLESYGLEVFINKLIIKHKLSLKIINWKNVENDFHQEKDWFLTWWRKNLKIWKNILKHWWWFFWIYKMNFDLIKLLKK